MELLLTNYYVNQVLEVECCLLLLFFKRNLKNHENSGIGGIISRQKILSLISLSQHDFSTFGTPVQGSHKLIKVKPSCRGKGVFSFYQCALYHLKPSIRLCKRDLRLTFDQYYRICVQILLSDPDPKTSFPAPERTPSMREIPALRSEPK